MAFYNLKCGAETGENQMKKKPNPFSGRNGKIIVDMCMSIYALTDPGKSMLERLQDANKFMISSLPASTATPNALGTGTPPVPQAEPTA